MTIDITVILQAVIALAAAVVTTFLIPWIKSNTSDKQRAQLEAWTKIAVEAAEQLFKGDGRRPERKEYVLNFLAEKGFTADLAEIETTIEGKVYELNLELKKSSEAQK